MRPRRHRNDFFSDDEGLNPMDYVSNLSDVMLILAVGIMLALIVRWNVDITPPDTSTAAGDPLQAEAAFTEDELDRMRDDATESPDSLEKRGELYYDAETGTYYIVESGSGA